MNKISKDFAKYYSKNPLQRFLVRKFLETASKTVQLLDIKEILDVGCGDGYVDRFLLKKNERLKITGVDISENILGRAKLVCPLMKTQPGDIHKLPFPDKSFELVICLEVLEHLKEPRNALKELKRVSGKYLFISVPWEPFFSLGNFLRGKCILRLGKNTDHRQFWTKKNFIKFLRSEVKVIRIFTPFPWILSLCEVSHQLSDVTC